MRLRLITVFAVVLLLILPAPALAADRYGYTASYHTSHAYAHPHPCTGEWVEFTGRYHELVAYQVDATTGEGHLTMHTDGTGVGIDASGDRYAVQSIGTQTTVLQDGSPYVAVLVNRYRVTSAGPEPDYQYSTSIRIVVDGQGIERQSLFDFELECTDGTAPAG